MGGSFGSCASGIGGPERCWVDGKTIQMCLGCQITGHMVGLGYVSVPEARVRAIKEY